MALAFPVLRQYDRLPQRLKAAAGAHIFVLPEQNGACVVNACRRRLRSAYSERGICLD